MTKLATHQNKFKTKCHSSRNETLQVLECDCEDPLK
jgi:hypothetical protein